MKKMNLAFIAVLMVFGIVGCGGGGGGGDSSSPDATREEAEAFLATLPKSEPIPMTEATTRVIDRFGNTTTIITLRTVYEEGNTSVTSFETVDENGTAAVLSLDEKEIAAVLSAYHQVRVSLDVYSALMPEDADKTSSLFYNAHRKKAGNAEMLLAYLDSREAEYDSPKEAVSGKFDSEIRQELYDTVMSEAGDSEIDSYDAAILLEEESNQYMLEVRTGDERSTILWILLGWIISDSEKYIEAFEGEM